MAHFFTQPHSLVQLARSTTEKARPIAEAEFPYRMSTYDVTPDDITAKNEISITTFKTPKDFGVPGSFKAGGGDRVSLLRSANLAEEHWVNLKPRSSPFDSP